jgi:hypothetical protein
MPGEIRPIAWPNVNAHFRNAFADRLAVTEIAVLRRSDAVNNSSTAQLVFECVEPLVKLLRTKKRVHVVAQLYLFGYEQNRRPYRRESPSNRPTRMRRVHPQHLLWLLNRLDVQIHRYRLAVAAAEDAFERLGGAGVDFLVGHARPSACGRGL